jgi:hypothetical protein
MDDSKIKAILDMDAKLTELMPLMPNDFWPEITVKGQYKNESMQFVLTDEVTLNKAIHELRCALWQSTMHADKDKIEAHFAKMRELING